VDRAENAPGELPRSLNHGALAFRHLSLGGDIDEARARYGEIVEDGTRVTVPALSPGALWTGAKSIYLTRLDRRRLTGLLFDGSWVGLSRVE
jgi:hypothetical protein